jgi:hypothetical protein
MNIGRLCNREVVVVHTSEPLASAARAMCESHLGMVVVARELARLAASQRRREAVRTVSAR